MFIQQVLILCNIPVVEAGNAKIEQDIKQECKIENRKVKAVFTGSRDVLHGTVDAQNPEWLDQQIKEKQKPQVSEKLTLHFLSVEELDRMIVVKSTIIWKEYKG
jgi:hypothetical protein